MQVSGSATKAFTGKKNTDTMSLRDRELQSVLPLMGVAQGGKTMCATETVFPTGFLF